MYIFQIAKKELIFEGNMTVDLTAVTPLYVEHMGTALWKVMQPLTFH